VDGQRVRRGLAVRDTYPEAAGLLKTAWESTKLAE
jgi:hypothetical protein